jgi:transposase
MSMDASSSSDQTPAASLPTDVATLQQQLMWARREVSHLEAVLAETAVTCDQQQAQLEKLQEELELFKRYLFGRRSERHVPDPRQGTLPLGEDAVQAVSIPAPPEDEVAYSRRKRGHGWSKLPKELRREEVLLDVPVEERQCVSCGEPLQKIGEDRSERLHVLPPRVWVKVLVRPKYACTCQQGGVKQTPPPPAPVPGGRFDFSFVAHVVTSKIADHLPLYRQQDILARSGLELSRSTMCQIHHRAAAGHQLARRRRHTDATVGRHASGGSTAGAILAVSRVRTGALQRVLLSREPCPRWAE